jgi:hypothetical protein
MFIWRLVGLGPKSLTRMNPAASTTDASAARPPRTVDEMCMLTRGLRVYVCVNESATSSDDAVLYIELHTLTAHVIAPAALFRN